MKNLFRFGAPVLSIFLSVVTPFGAQAVQTGGGGTGGGGAHVCPSYEEKSGLISGIKSAELYDLYEAREARRYGLIDPKGKNANQLLNIAMEKIFAASPYYALSVSKTLNYYAAKKVVVKNKNFEIIKDAKLVFIDVGCQYQQIAQWHDDYEAIFIDDNLNEIFRQSELNVAGLALHEAIYAVERSQGAGDSNFSRKLVAQAFSENTPVTALDTRIAQMKQKIAVSNLNKQLIVRVIFLSERETDVYNVTITSSFPKFKFNEGKFSYEYDQEDKNNCTLTNTNKYCDFTLTRKNIATNFNVKATLDRREKKSDSTTSNNNVPKPNMKFRIDIFENGNLIDSVIEEDVQYSINEQLYSISQYFSLFPTYKEFMEKEILGLDLTLKAKK